MAVDELPEVDGIGDATLGQLRALRHGLRWSGDGHRPADVLLAGGGAGALGSRWAGWWTVVVPGRDAGVVVLRLRRVPLAVVLVLGGAGCVTGLRAAQVAGSPVAALAADRAVVRVEGTVASDPRRTTGPTVTSSYPGRRAGGHRPRATYALSVPVLVLGDTDWVRARPRQPDRGVGPPGPGTARTRRRSRRSRPARGHRRCRRLVGRRAAVRASIRDTVAGRPEAQRALVPAPWTGTTPGSTRTWQTTPRHRAHPSARGVRARTRRSWSGSSCPGPLGRRGAVALRRRCGRDRGIRALARTEPSARARR